MILFQSLIDQSLLILNVKLQLFDLISIALFCHSLLLSESGNFFLAHLDLCRKSFVLLFFFLQRCFKLAYISLKLVLLFMGLDLELLEFFFY